jgi:hypothetical protein
MAATTLSRTAGIEKAMVALVVAAGLTSVLTLLIGRTVIDEAERYLAGDVSRTDFITSITPYLLVTFLQGAATVATGVLVVIWMYRIAANHRALHRSTTWGPGWGIAGWILPPLLYVIPLLMLREMWKASNPDVPIGGEWRKGSGHPLLYAWFVVYSLIPLVLLPFQSSDITASFGSSEDALADGIVGSVWPTVISTAVSVVGAVLFVLVARGIGSRHRRLTGEVTA